MIKNKFAVALLRLIKRVIEKLYYNGVFEILEKKRENISNSNILLEENCSVHPSAVLITNENGKIVLNGNNYIGRNTELQPSNNCSIKIGYGTSIQDRNIILGDVEIGKFCLTAPNVYMSSGRHYFGLNPNFYIKDQDEMVSFSKDLSKKHSKKIIIEDDVWIGINSVIMPGITIARGSVIGSNSVVTKNVSPFSIMAGAPAKLIKKRLDFVPKTSINFNNDNDLPNFYKGFFNNVKNLQEDRELGGIAASNSFLVYLTDVGLKIQLTIKRLINSPIILSYNNQDILFSESGFENICFDMSNCNYHHFMVKSEEVDENSKVFLIKEIKVLI